MMVRFGALILLSALLGSTGFSQSSRGAEIKRIDGYVKTLNSFAKRNSRSKLVFADVSDQEQSKVKWLRFKNESELERFREDTEVYALANVWRRSGKVVLAAFTFSSPSGDWAKYLSMYFRVNGTLAKSESELRTFYGDLVVRQNFYFDGRGRLLKKTKNYFDLASGKPKKPDVDFHLDQKDTIEEENYYLTTRQLPFARLLLIR